jgi:hypothetical protein
MRMLPVLLLLGCTTVVADAAPGARRIEINGRPLTRDDAVTLARLEKQTGRRAPDGRYWYDARCGATGMWGGPTLGFLPAGLALGGPLPAEASGGGSGRLTGVFINGREIHPTDAQGLIAMLGQVVPGRYWVDAAGNAGYEGGPPLFNLFAVAQQRGAKGGSTYYKRGAYSGDSTYVGQGCAAISGRKAPRSDSETYSYFVGCE